MNLIYIRNKVKHSGSCSQVTPSYKHLVYYFVETSGGMSRNSFKVYWYTVPPTPPPPPRPHPCQSIHQQILYDVNLMALILAESEQNTRVPEELPQPDNSSSKLLERNRERRKVVSAALGDLVECDEEEEEEAEDLSMNLSTSPLSTLSSFKNKFQLSFTGRRKVRVCVVM